MGKKVMQKCNTCIFFAYKKRIYQKITSSNVNNALFIINN